MRQSEKFWETQGEEINQTRKKRKAIAVHGSQAALSGAPGNAKDCPVKRNQPTVSTPVLAHSLQPPGFSAAENADWGHSNHWVQLSHSDCFAAVLWKVCLNHLISQHSWSVFICVCICVCSQSSTHHVCDIPYVVQRSQPHSSWASLSHSTGLCKGGLPELGLRLTITESL